MATAAKKASPLVPPNAFIGRATKPKRADLAAALHEATPLWDALVDGFAAEFDLKPEWNSYSIKHGWAVRLKKKDRNILYLGPYSGGFAAMVILGAKALETARKDLPSQVFAGAKKYPEGTAVRVEMRSHADLAIARRLVAAKLG
jgi:hypothetical protein